jgi:hypothetical protein
MLRVAISISRGALVPSVAARNASASAPSTHADRIFAEGSVGMSKHPNCIICAESVQDFARDLDAFPTVRVDEFPARVTARHG